MRKRGKSQERMQRSETENKVEIKERPEPHLQRIAQYLLWLSTLLLVTLEAGWVILYNYALHLLKVKVFKFHDSRHVTGQAGSQDFRSRPTLPYHQNSPFFTNYQVGSDLSGRQLTDGRTDQILPFFIFASSPFSSCSHWIGEGPVIDILALRSLLY